MKHPYEDFVHGVEKPARYMGGEYGEIIKDWEAVDCRICLAFPDVYEVGMSHLGYKILYAIINRHPRLLAERAFAPWIDMEAQLRERGQPLRSLESRRPLHEFDVVGFSLQFELSFTNVLQMLELGSIPLRCAERGDDHPLIVAGGPNALHPEPMAPFIDAFAVGDGEELTGELMLLWSELGRSGLSRAKKLERLSTLKGVYVPALYPTAPDPDTGLHYVSDSHAGGAALPVRRVWIDDIDAHPFPCGGPVAGTETVFDRVSVEIARGCTEGCRFCQAGVIYRPVRERNPKQIIGVIERSVRDDGYEAASLTSLSTADYSAITPLIAMLTPELEDERISLVVSSLRGYGLDRTVLSHLRKSRTTGLTLAPEAGSQRMRDVINKNIDEQQLMETAERIFSGGWSKIKLYFMIGLPSETDQDVRSIIETGARIQQVGRKHHGKRAEVTVSVSTHVPKPHTPFQWCAMDALAEIERKQAILRNDARGARLVLRLHDPSESWVEGVLARGDRTLGDVIEAAYRHGARFDSWSEQLKLEAWRAAFEETSVEPDRFLRELPIKSHLPWEHIQTLVDRDFLEKEHRRAWRGRTTPPCGKPAGMLAHHTNLDDLGADDRPLVCHKCGIDCDLDRMRDRRERFLNELDARSPEPEPDRRAPQAGSEPNRKNVSRRRPPPRPDQGVPVRVRLGFSKLGPAAFGSHLDLIRTLPRVLKRAGLPLMYSSGFHPKAMMVFGPALAVGIPSLAEYVDIKLRQGAEPDCAGLPEQLTAVSPGGIAFFGARVLGADDPKLSRVIDEAVYVATLSAEALRYAGLNDAGALARRVEQRRNRELVVRRTAARSDKTIHVSRYLVDALVGEAAQSVEQAGVAAGSAAMTLRIRITPGGTARPGEALDALLDATGVPARFVRAALLWTRRDVRATPLDLEVLRSGPGSKPDDGGRQG